MCYYIKSGVKLTVAEYEVLCEGRNAEHGMAVDEDEFDQFFSVVRLLQSGVYDKAIWKASDYPFDIPKLLSHVVICPMQLTCFRRKIPTPLRFCRR